MSTQAPPNRQPDRSEFVSINRTRLRVWEWGDPNDPVVLGAHGAYDHGRMLDGIAAGVADMGWHVRVFDLRGHGDSGPIDSGHTFDATVLDLGTIASAYEHPVGMIAHSMGASMAFNTAATWPEHIAWIVSFDGLGPPAEAFDHPPLSDLVPMATDSLIKALGRDRRVFADRREMADQRGAINRRVPKAWLDHLVRHGTMANDTGWSWKWHPLFTTFIPHGFQLEWATVDMELVQCPVLLFTGLADDMWTFPNAEVERRLTHFPDVEHIPVADAGHYLHLERPEFVLGEIERFLGQQLRSAR